MPNHITNRVTISGAEAKELAKVLRQIVGDNGELDFNCIIPVPKSLGIPSGTDTDIGLALVSGIFPRFSQWNSVEEVKEYVNSHKRFKLNELMKLGSIAANNIKNYGVATWYEYKREVWGTKWNAYNQKFLGVEYKRWMKDRCYAKRQAKKRVALMANTVGIKGFTFEFDTAWSTPQPIIIELSERFPAVTFELNFADEDLGSNCGKAKLIGGEFISSDIAPDWNKQTPEDKKKWMEFAFNLTRPNVDPKSYGYDENWDYSEQVENHYLNEIEGNKVDSLNP